MTTKKSIDALRKEMEILQNQIKEREQEPLLEAWNLVKLAKIDFPTLALFIFEKGKTETKETEMKDLISQLVQVYGPKKRGRKPKAPQ
jgi:hypothetical protein